MKLKEYNAHDFKELHLEMSLKEAIEVMVKLAKAIDSASNNQYNAGFYHHEDMHFDDGSGYPDYLNTLQFQIQKPKEKTI